MKIQITYLGYKDTLQKWNITFWCEQNIMKCFINQLLYLFGGIDRDVTKKRSSNWVTNIYCNLFCGLGEAIIYWTFITRTRISKMCEDLLFSMFFQDRKTNPLVYGVCLCHFSCGTMWYLMDPSMTHTHDPYIYHLLKLRRHTCHTWIMWFGSLRRSLKRWRYWDWIRPAVSLYLAVSI